MEIRNVKHKGFKRFIETGSLKGVKGLPSQYRDKFRDILTYLTEIDAIDEVYNLTNYKAHTLTGDRTGTISFHITGNWRITFKHDEETNEIYDLNYEDYHDKKRKR